METDEVDLRSFGFSAEVSLNMAADLKILAKEKKGYSLNLILFV